jgi:cell division septation protein DedD
MTKAELIRKIVKRSGIPDSEAKVFFEIFLQKTSAMLKTGQAVKLKNFGYFQLRNAVFTTSAPKISGRANQIDTEIIVFSSFEDKKDDGLVFNIPARVSEKYNYVDSYFSLSIGKPVIPLKGVKDTDYFITPTGFEMRKLIESKVNKLLEDVEIIKNYVNDNEVIYLKKSSFGGEYGEPGWSTGNLDNGTFKVNSIDEDSGIPDIVANDTNFNNVSWDFGGDLSRQIEEEAIIDASSEPPSPLIIDEPEQKSSLVWDFGEQFSDEQDAGIENKEIDSTKEVPSENISKDFQRVKAITSEFNFDNTKSEDTVTEEPLEWDFGKYEADEDNLSGNEDAAVVTEEFVTPDVAEQGSAIEILQEPLVEEKPQITEPETELLTIPEPEVKPVAVPEPEVKKPVPAEKVIEKPHAGVSYYSKKKSFFPFLLAMFTIIAVGAAVFIYVNKISLYNLSTGKLFKSGKIKSVGIAPKVIDRSFDVPVTYPYPKDSKQNNAAADTELNSALSNKVKSTQAPGKKNIPAVSNTQKKTEKPKQEIKSQPTANTNKTSVPKEATQKVKDNVYQQGKNFVAQISSWQSKSSADKEVARLKAKGYAAYVEKAELPGRGAWFRVKVGNFNSAAEAEKFSAKNK